VPQFQDQLDEMRRSMPVYEDSTHILSLAKSR
jgi:hypothetical protein